MLSKHNSMASHHTTRCIIKLFFLIHVFLDINILLTDNSINTVALKHHFNFNIYKEKIVYQKYSHV